MNNLLVMLHILGFGAGAASGVGSAVVGAKIAASPGDAPVLGKIPPVLARVGQIGIALLWATGPILVYSKYDGPESLGGTFSIKFALAVILTGLVVAMAMRMRRVSKGDMAAAALLPVLGRIAGAVLILIVVFAVLTFASV